MARFDKINTLQIGNHIWVFSEPQVIEYQDEDDGVTMKAVLHIDHEEDIKIPPPKILCTIVKPKDNQ